MSLYTPTDQLGQPLNTVYAEDVAQLVNVLTGQRDAGALSLLQALAAPAAPSVTLQSGAITGTGYRWGVYWITGLMDGTGTPHITGRTPVGTLTTAQALTAQQATVSISGLTPPTGTIGWGVARNKSGGGTWYTVPGSEQFMSVAGTIPSSFVDNVADASLVTAAPTSNTTGTTGWGTTKLWDSVEAGVSFPSASVSTPTLPQNYKHLLVQWQGRSSTATAVEYLGVRMNGDSSAADYTDQLLQGNNATATASQEIQAITFMRLGVIAAGSAASSEIGSGLIFIPDYQRSTGFVRLAVALSGAWTDKNSGDGFVGMFSGQWVSTAAVTALTFLAQGGGNLVAPSRFTVYGMA